MTPEFLMAQGAPMPVAPFSHAVRVGPWLFVTGQMPTFPENDARPLPEGIEAQTRRVIANLEIVLGAAAFGLADIVFARVYLTHFDEDYARMNDVWASYFPPDRRPARTCVGVTALARGARVEIDLFCCRSG